MKATLEFQIKRGLVDSDSLDASIIVAVDKCLHLCESGNYAAAAAKIKPCLYFEWVWSNCDGNPSDIFLNCKDVSFPCSDLNSSVRVGDADGDLVLTAAAWFEVDVKPGIGAGEITDWLVDKSAWACGYIGGGWSYLSSDGDNVWLTKLS